MGLRVDQKIVIVTRPTQLAALRKKFATRSQAKFQIVSAKRRELARKADLSEKDVVALAEEEFGEVDRSAALYDEAVQQLRSELDFSDFDLPVQTVDRDFLPNFL